MKKRFSAVLLTMAMLLSLLPAAALAAEEDLEPSYVWYTGAAEGATEYTISTVADLMGLAKITQNKAATESDSSIPSDNFENKTVKLGADLDLSGVKWLEVDSSGTVVSNYRIVGFAGTFDGQNHTISNLSFVNENSDQTSGYSMGLFSTVVNGTVKNLTLDTVTAKLAAKDRFGALANSLTGTAENCHVKNVTVTGSNDNTSDNCASVGGLIRFVGDANGTTTAVKNCSAETVHVNITGYVGWSSGLLGCVNGNSTVENCSARDVSFAASTTYIVAGLIGNVQNTYVSSTLRPVTITGSTAANVSITSTGDMPYAGGFVGSVNRGVTFTGCKAEAVTIRGGSTAESSIGQVGGFAANTQNGDSTNLVTFTGCSVTGLDMTLTGKINVDTSGKSLDNGIGGFASNFSNGTKAENCSVAGRITANVTGGEVGGFLGNLGWNNLTGTVLTNCTADVDITVSGTDAVAGGFLGSAQMDYNEAARDVVYTFSGCAASGDVTNESGPAGGFVGDGYRGTYTNCTAAGDVTGVTAGGFWGEVVASPKTDNVDSDITISGCEATGSVLGSESAGGFLGTAATSHDEGDTGSATSVSITGSSASPIVAGTSDSTTVSPFLNSATENDTNITLGTGEDANTEAELTVTPKENGETITRDSDGSLLLPSGGAVIKRTDEDTGTEISGGSTIAADGSITIPAGGSYGETIYPNGATVDADGAVKKNAVLTLSENSGTVYSGGGTATFTYSYDGDGAVTARSADETKATVSVDQTAKRITVTGGSATGSVTITVSAAATENCNAASATYSLTVAYPGGSPSFGNSVTTTATANGTLTVTPSYAAQGTTVVVTPTPSAGYELASLTVTDANGNLVALIANANGTYSFTMPSSRVTVSAAFSQIAPKPLPFVDVADSAWYADAVRYVYEKGLMTGATGTTFAPETATTRGMLVTILYRLEGEPAAGTANFTDVSAGMYYAKAVAWAAANDIVTGYNGAFDPDSAITREQMAAILYRYAAYKGYDVSARADLSSYRDHGEISAYAVDAMRWANAEGLITGYNAALDPQGASTRVVVATILMRFCENVAK